jgi:tetratricopeptide (TPR) repeat protein
LKGKDSIRNAALATVSYARAVRLLGDIDNAGSASAEAVRLATNLQQSGDTSEATTIALARAYEVQSAVLSNTADAKTVPTIERAAQILKPIAMAPGASVAARRAYAVVLTTLGFEQSHAPREYDKAYTALQRAKSISADLGGRDLKSLEAAVMYAEAGAWQLEVLQRLGRIDEARAVGIDAAAVAAKVLEVRPAYRNALHANQLIQGDLGGLAQDDLRPAEAIAYNLRSIDISRVQIKLDPNNTIAWNNLSIAYLTVGDVAWSQGRVRESVDYYRQALDAVGRASHAGAWFVLNALYPTGILALRQADSGMPEAAQKTRDAAVAAGATLHSTEPGGSQVPIFADCYLKFVEAGLALARDDPQSARRAGQDSARAVRDRVPNGGFQGFFKEQCTFNAVDEQGQAEYLLGDYAAAERTLRAALESRKEYPDSSNQDHRDVADTSTMLALTVARQGRLSEAAQIIEPVVKLHRMFAARNHGDGLQKVELAKALYVQAMCEPGKRRASLHEAAAQMDGVPAGVRSLHSVRLWQNWIGEAQKR